MYRILHVTESFGAGVQHAIAQYCRSLPDSAHTVLAKRRPEDVLIDQAAHLVEVPSLNQLRTALKRLALQHDVIHAHSSVAGGVTRLSAAPIRRKLAYSPHALAYLGPHSRPKKWALTQAERALTGRARAYGAVSRSEAQELQSLGVARGRIVLVPHVIPLPHETNRGRSLGALRLVTVGRITPQKDPNFLLELKRHVELEEDGTRHDWIWIGHGDPNLTAELEAGGVTVTGWLNPAEVSEYLRTAHAVVHTARYEGMPIAVLESMAHGTPVLARDIPPLREVPVDLFRTADEFHSLLRRLDEQSRWRQSGSTSRAHIERHHQMPSQREALLKLYRLAAGNQARVGS